MTTKVFSQSLIISENHTAIKCGSGTLPVFATPALIAFMENTAMKLIYDLNDGETSVGTSINVKHLKASSIGETIQCKAIITSNEEQKYSFQIFATNENNEIIGEGTHERIVINIDRFMRKLKREI